MFDSVTDWQTHVQNSTVDSVNRWNTLHNSVTYISQEVVNLSEQDHRAVIQFLGVEGCQPAQIHRQICTIYGTACVSKTSVYFEQGRQQTIDILRPGKAQCR